MFLRATRPAPDCLTRPPVTGSGGIVAAWIGVEVMARGGTAAGAGVAATVARGRARAAVGFVGAFMQPQAQVQSLVRMLDQGHDPQAAIDAPRLRVEPDRGHDGRAKAVSSG